jgi:hypothetical protein
LRVVLWLAGLLWGLWLRVVLWLAGLLWGRSLRVVLWQGAGHRRFSSAAVNEARLPCPHARP